MEMKIGFYMIIEKNRENKFSMILVLIWQNLEKLTDVLLMDVHMDLTIVEQTKLVKMNFIKEDKTCWQIYKKKYQDHLFVEVMELMLIIWLGHKFKHLAQNMQDFGEIWWPWTTLLLKAIYLKLMEAKSVLMQIFLASVLLMSILPFWCFLKNGLT